MKPSTRTSTRADLVARINAMEERLRRFALDLDGDDDGCPFGDDDGAVPSVGEVFAALDALAALDAREAADADPATGIEYGDLA